MSTLQHTAQLRIRATRHLVLLVVIALVAAAGVAAAIVAITTGGGSSSVGAHSRPAVAEPMYSSGALERQLAPLRQARAQAATERGLSPKAPSPQTPGQRP
jgi:hypothetical protein